jgi:RNA polymerase sigma-70 factor, ECF subfamily
VRQTDEISLIKRVKSGDIKALEKIFVRYYVSLCKFLSLVFKNQIEAENVAQDIFVYLWEHRENIEIKESVESYLRKMPADIRIMQRRRSVK